MTNFDKIYEIAVDNYGLISTKQANNEGVTNAELARFVKQAKLTRRNQGLYKLVKYVPVNEDIYAEAVMTVGEDAYLYGTAVMALLALGLVNPNRLTIATPKRVRKKMPPWIELVNRDKKEEVTQILGIPSQNLVEAFKPCKDKIMPDRLDQAMQDAYNQGYINNDELHILRSTNDKNSK